MNHRQHSNLNPRISESVSILQSCPLRPNFSLLVSGFILVLVFLLSQRNVYSSKAAVSLCSVRSKIYYLAAWPSADGRKNGQEFDHG